MTRKQLEAKLGTTIDELIERARASWVRRKLAEADGESQNWLAFHFDLSLVLKDWETVDCKKLAVAFNEANKQHDDPVPVTAQAVLDGVVFLTLG